MKIVNIEEFQRLVADGSVDIVDVREPNEWATGHIPGARLVPLAQVKSDPIGSAPNDRVVFVCAKGGRSATAAQAVEQSGKKLVYSLEGGTQGWVAAGLPLTMPSQSASKNTAENKAPSPTEALPSGVKADDPALDALVAVSLRQHRAAQGWSLDDLAREAGISRTLLGQIELGQTAPSIGLVWKIAQTLGVPFSALLNTEPRAGTVVTQRASAKRLLSADGRFSSRALFPLGDPKAPEFYELWLAPYSREDAEAHRPGTRENIIVTAGQLELHIGRDVRLLEKGDAVVFTADVPHSYVNPGREECWMYLVMSYR